jgi:hypothetical protein
MLLVKAWDKKQEPVLRESTAATPLAIMLLGEQARNASICNASPCAVVILAGPAKLKRIAMDDCTTREWILGTLRYVCVGINTMAIGRGCLRSKHRLRYIARKPILVMIAANL